MSNYTKGVSGGISIGLGYFSVSFSFGILAVKSGLGVFPTTLTSMTNLTSAGQFAGLGSIVADSGLVALALTQLIINLRYALMSLSLSQKLSSKVGTLKRCLIAFFNTDEIFAVAMGQEGKVGLSYMLGLATLPWLGWTLGTLTGATAGEILPASVSSALGVALFAMFIAIVVPPAKEIKAIRVTALLASALSCFMLLFPALQTFSIIICTILAASYAALRYPVDDEKEEEE